MGIFSSCEHRLDRVDKTESDGTEILTELFALRLLVTGGAWRAWDINDTEPTLPAVFLDLLKKFAALQKKGEKLRSDVEWSEYSGELITQLRANNVSGAPKNDETPLVLTRALRAAEKKYAKCSPFGDICEANLELLCDIFGLTALEAKVFAFYTLVNNHSPLLDIVRRWNCAKRPSTFVDIIACALDVDRKDVQKALSENSALCSSGLLSNSKRSEREDFDDHYSIDRDDISSVLMIRSLSRDQITEALYTEAPPSELTSDEFSYIPEVEELLIPFIAAAMRKHTVGANVLLYGPPGTGKTQLSRLIADELGFTAYELTSEQNTDAKGDRRDRLWGMALQSLSKSEHSLLLIDEAEDIFNAGLMSTGEGVVRINKGRINKLLEENRVPVIWMTNSTRGWDPAMLRRFDIVLKVDTPTKTQRMVQFERVTGETANEALLEQFAATDGLSLGLVKRAVRVVNLLDIKDPTQRSLRLKSIVETMLETQYGKSLYEGASADLPESYSTEYVNTTANLQAIANGIAANPHARLCLYGVPGTGKTAYGHWLADQLEMPIKEVRASDLLDCFLGGTEQKIKEAFQEAKEEGAILLLDEADSFLRDRTGAVRSWEVTQVNEMLTQMEKFDGIFIATTNLLDTIDAASLRRFDLKVKFEPMRPEQTKALFLAECSQYGFEKAEDSRVFERLNMLTTLTPGDFSTVRRQAKFSPITSAEELVGRLEDEEAVRLKKTTRRAIGF